IEDVHDPCHDVDDGEEDENILPEPLNTIAFDLTADDISSKLSNKELEILERALQIAIDATKSGGRVAVLTYHSGENRIVKRVFSESERDANVQTTASPFMHESQSGERRTRRVRAPKHPSSKEQTLNRRAKSARLRVLEKTLVGVGN
ncbi:MAG: 16S rRNA (cytosine(1402)-N(4))-methyltransferase, partial [Ilumatobacteraceae bacterium]